MSAACGMALLAAVPAAASTLPPTALLNSGGTVAFSSASGLTLNGSLIAEYRTPTGAARPYVFATSLDLGPLDITPSFTVTTQERVLIPESCITIFGRPICTPAVVLPSLSVDLSPTIPLLASTTIFDKSFTSPDLPLGALFGFDYGTPLFGTPLTFGDLVQDQFETGATTVSVAGAVGPFGGVYNYSGVLQPGGEVILADYSLSLTGPGLIADIEGYLLGLLNDNTDLLFDLAFEQLLASNPCAGLGLSAVATGLCNAFIGGLDQSEVSIAVTSLGTVTGGYELSKSITPVPVPFSLPLLASGLAVMGFVGSRRRKASAA
jgi:hypothetical protein